MGLFDGYVDPQQFDNGGGLLGRLLALQKFPDQYQDHAGLDQTPPASQTMPPAAMLSPFLSGLTQAYSQSAPADPAAPSRIPGVQDGMASAGSAEPVANPSPSQAPAQNTILAQYSSARPSGVFVPPNVFVPGTPENDAFVHSTINAGRAIGNAVGNILNNDSSNDNSTPITPRHDVPALAGGRAGEYVPGLTGPPNSAILGGPGRIFITDGNGNVVVDVTRERAKDITPGQGSGRKRDPTPQEQELLKKMGR